MKVIIVGAGIAGLSLAIALAKSRHQVLILDAAPALAELGAGMQMTPQAIKYLFQWGMRDDIMAKSIIPNEMFVRDFASGEVLDAIPTGAMEERYGAPYIVVHRAVLHELLHKHAVKSGAELRLDSKVVSYDFANGQVELRNGLRLTADLVVGADGINSFSRKQLLGERDPASIPTGFAAIRMMAEVARVDADPMLAELTDLKTHSSHLWIAPGRSCMTYQIKDGTLLNIVLSHADDIDMSKFTVEEYKAFVKRSFQDFEPKVQKLLDLVLPKMQNFPVYAVPPLPNWIDPSGRFALLGDAAHAMAFYLSMGVSLAVEDAVSLTTALDLAYPATGEQQPVDYIKLKTCLRAFQQARKERVKNVQEASLQAGRVLHVEDPATRQKVYAALKADGLHDPSVSDTVLATKGLTYGLGDQRVRDWCFGHDTVKHMKDCYKAVA